MPNRADLSIGDVLSALQKEFPEVTISKIRFLETQGLVTPQRTRSGNRRFSDGDVDQLRWILEQQTQHFLPLKVIKDRLKSNTPARRQTKRKGGAGVTAPRNSFGLTKQELCESTKATLGTVDELESNGLITGRQIAGNTYFDEDALEIVKTALAFLQFGLEPRHLRVYKNAAKREAGLFEQIITPMLKQRNAKGHSKAVQTLSELTELGESLRLHLLSNTVKELTGE